MRSSIGGASLRELALLFNVCGVLEKRNAAAGMAAACNGMTPYLRVQVPPAPW